jgi:hypothetical protein
MRPDVLMMNRSYWRLYISSRSCMPPGCFVPPIGRCQHSYIHSFIHPSSSILLPLCHLRLFLPQPSLLGFVLPSIISSAFLHRISCLTTATLPGPSPVAWCISITFGPSWQCGLHNIGGSFETTVDRFPTVKDHGPNNESPSQTSVWGVPTSLVSSGPAW